MFADWVIFSFNNVVFHQQGMVEKSDRELFMSVLGFIWIILIIMELISALPVSCDSPSVFSFRLCKNQAYKIGYLQL